MKALTVIPEKANTLSLDEIEEPVPTDNQVLVQVELVGICGTDLEIISGAYGSPPPGKEKLVLGHESLGHVIKSSSAKFQNGDTVVAIVRNPDPEPCYSCRAQRWDMCKNGKYREHGIKELDGFMLERYAINEDYLVRLDPSLKELGVLLEPTSVVAKAWEQVELVGNRTQWEPKKAVITGAGPIGLLAAMIGVQKGYDVHVVDQVSNGLKPDLVKSLGATYHISDIEEASKEADIAIEATGVASLIFDLITNINPCGVVCLTGVSPVGRTINFDFGLLNRDIVLENEVIVGSVNAAKSHYEQGATYLKNADLNWLSRLITRKVPIDSYQLAFEREPDDVKVVLDLR